MQPLDASGGSQWASKRRTYQSYGLPRRHGFFDSHQRNSIVFRLHRSLNNNKAAVPGFRRPIEIAEHLFPAL
jgi:hypothetical protein